MSSKTITDRQGDTIRVSTGSFTALAHEVTIKVTEKYHGRKYAAAVHVDPRELRAALDEVAPFKDEPDYDMDGGVTAAAIENEVVSPERARSLVQENEELRARIGRVEEARDLYRRDALTEERLHGEARRFALAWKETARENILRHRSMRRSMDIWQSAAQRLQVKLDKTSSQLHDALDEQAQLAENPRPLAAGDITDEMVERAALAEKFVPTTVSHKDLLRGILRAALSDPRPVYSPLLEDDLAAFHDTQEPYTDKARADWLTARGWRKTADDFLAERGVRVTGDAS